MHRFVRLRLPIGAGRHRLGGTSRPILALACRILVACLPAALAASGRSVSAQQLRVPGGEAFGVVQFPTPPVLPQPALDLSDAVRLTLGHSPVIGQSRETLRLDEGRHREAGGLFDPLFAFVPSLIFTKQQLSPSIAVSELERRTTLQIVANDFSALSQALADEIALKPNAGPPRCPKGLRVGTSLPSNNALVGLFLQAEVAQLGATGGVRSNAAPDLLTTAGGTFQFDFSEICSGDIDALVQPAVYRSAWNSLNQLGGLGIQGALQSIGQTQLDTLTLQSQNARNIATRAALALQQLGPVPVDSRQNAASFDVSLFKLFRNGITFGGDVTLASQDEEYVGKPLDPAFGGNDVPSQFTSSAKATVEIPLGRGRGRTAVDAPEVAAERTAVGDREQLRHDASTEVFRTILSYLNLIAAQEQVRLLEESAARQRQIAQLTESAVAGGTAPEIERNRARARAAIVEAGLAAARAGVVAARVGLAQTIGIDLNEVAQAPIATQSFTASTPALPSADDLARQALAIRRDTRALDRRSEAAAALAAGARANLPRQITLSFQAGLSTLYDSPLSGNLSDGQAGQLSSVRSYSPVGYSRSLKAPWAPFAVVSLSLALPFGNHAAKGRLGQAESTLRESRIRTRDLQRVISENVIDTADAVRRAAAAVGRWDAAVAGARQTLDAALQRFQLGDLTLIDVLLTEQELTDDLQQSVAEQQIHLSTLARLRYETGGLVSFENEGTPNEAVTFDASQFVRQP